MASHPLNHATLKQVIQAADKAISEENFDALMDFYADDATLVIKPGLTVTGKANIREAFAKIAAHFQHSLVVKQGKMEVIQGGDTALVIMESLLEFRSEGKPVQVTRRATYVFREEAGGRWVCVVDNSYGTELLSGE